MLKIIISDFKELIQWIRNYLFHRRHAIRLRLAIKLADMKQKAWNKQYFVILSPSDKLISINNLEVERLKRLPRYNRAQLRSIEKSLLLKEEEAKKEMIKDEMNQEYIEESLCDMRIIREKTIARLRKMKLLPKNLDGIKLRQMAFYYTPLSKNNDPGMSQEDRQEAKKRYMTYAKKYLLK